MRFHVPLSIALTVTLLVLASPGVAHAQDCGNWREALLCTGELELRDVQGRSQSFDPDRDTLQLAPDQSVELSLNGRDQTGRTFPAYRLHLMTDDRECDRYLEVENLGEGRIRIEASRTEGNCRLDVWLPGNLNFAWQVGVRVAYASRTSYDGGEAEFIARGLFRAVLGREGEFEGISAAADEIARGNLEDQIRAMVTGQEFLEKQRSMDRSALLSQFYEGLLGRRPDSVGVRTFDEDMSYRRYTDVLLGIIRTQEFEDRMRRER